LFDKISAVIKADFSDKSKRAIIGKIVRNMKSVWIANKIVRILRINSITDDSSELRYKNSKLYNRIRVIAVRIKKAAVDFMKLLLKLSQKSRNTDVPSRFDAFFVET